MLLKIFIALVIAVALVAVVISMQPASYRVVRTTTIAAPPAAIYARISDFHNWNAWSPWAKLDPDMKQTFEGAPSGTGARYLWAGNSAAGEGSMAISEAVVNERVVIQLAFLKPFPSASKITFSLRPEGSGTSVEWAMTGTAPLPARQFSYFPAWIRW